MSQHFGPGVVWGILRTRCHGGRLGMFRGAENVAARCVSFLSALFQALVRQI